MSVAHESLHGKKLSPAGSNIVLVEWTLGAGSADPDDPQWMAPPHIHHEDDEAWYVLEGHLQVRVDGRDYLIPAGGAVIAPRGAAHTFCNPDPEPARYLMVMTPRIDGLIQQLHTTKDRDPESMRALYAEYGARLLG
jgi:mannose-6-phosphate isomerase-like protein (cupin superfamily)